MDCIRFDRLADGDSNRVRDLMAVNMGANRRSCTHGMSFSSRPAFIAERCSKGPVTRPDLADGGARQELLPYRRLAYGPADRARNDLCSYHRGHHHDAIVVRKYEVAVGHFDAAAVHGIADRDHIHSGTEVDGASAQGKRVERKRQDLGRVTHIPIANDADRSSSQGRRGKEPAPVRTQLAPSSGDNRKLARSQVVDEVHGPAVG